MKRITQASIGLQSKIRKINLAERMSRIEILKPPIKSCSDKKEYRHVKLQNGMKALLVQHFIEEENLEDEDSKNIPVRISESDISTEGEDDSGSEEDEGDENQKEKMAAVALAISVGSFRDPKEIQGLSHFLEHMVCLLLAVLFLPFIIFSCL